MGNQQGKPGKDNDSGPKTETDKLAEHINMIAGKLITEQGFGDMKNLLDAKKCNDLVILTADVLEKHFTSKEVEYLDHRIKEGSVDTNPDSAIKTDNITFVEKKNIPDLDLVARDRGNRNLNTKKRRICIGLAKFYIKVAHVFAAIKSTINEEYLSREALEEERPISSSSQDYNIRNEAMTDYINRNRLRESNDYERERQRRMERENPEKIDMKQYLLSTPKGGGISSNRLSLCGRRLISLLREKPGQNGTELHPDFCNSENANRITDLSDELGIKELEILYKNLYEYDETTGDWRKQFKGMDEGNKKLFQEDLLKFYNQFTSDYVNPDATKESKLPDGISKFNDIKVPNYSKTVRCDQKSGQPGLNSSFLYMVGDELVVNPTLKEYVEHVKKMEDKVQAKHKELIEIIKELFKNLIDTTVEPPTEIIVINPDLDYPKLQEIVVKTRNLIVNMYLECDEDYKKGLQIYSKMIAEKFVEDAAKTTERLTEEREKILSEEGEESFYDKNENDSLNAYEQRKERMDRYSSRMDVNIDEDSRKDREESPTYIKNIEENKRRAINEIEKQAELAKVIKQFENKDRDRETTGVDYRRQQGGRRKTKYRKRKQKRTNKKTLKATKSYKKNKNYKILSK